MTTHLTLALKPTDAGYPLMALIIDQINREGLNVNQACERMGISTRYFRQLRKKEVLLDNMRTEYYHSIAGFLNTSPLAVRIMAGQIEQKEFYRQGTDIPLYINRAIHYISDDPDWQPLVPASLDNTDLLVKLLVIRLYEQATDTQLIAGSIDYHSLLNELQEHKLIYQQLAEAE